MDNNQIDEKEKKKSGKVIPLLLVILGIVIIGVGVFLMLNEKDEYDRNGLMYLIIHNNLTMIKLTILSCVILSDCNDINGRNLVHYCCTEYSSSDLLDKILSFY